MSKYVSLAVLVAVLLGVTAGQTDRDTLFFSSPGEKNRLGIITRVAGLYGGKVNSRTPELARNLFEAGYHCAEYSPDVVVSDSVAYNPLHSTELLDQLDIESLSFDPEKGEALVKVRTAEPTHLTVFQGSLCTGIHTCRNNTLKPLFYNVQVSEQISPLALHDGQVYFVLTRNTKVSRLSTLRTVELRMLDGRCSKDFPLDQGSMFDVNDCSELIVQLDELEYEKVVPVSATSTLLVLPSGTSRNFFVQLLYTHQDETTGDIITNIVLKRISPDKKVHDIHSESVDRGYLMYEMQHVGGISVKDERICWSAFDCIYCARWKDQKVSDITLKLHKGQANEICEGPRGEPMLAQIVTGVAIANATSGDLYFGCIAQITNVGGLGFLRHDSKGRVTLSAVRSNYTGPAGSPNNSDEDDDDEDGDGDRKEKEYESTPGGQRVFAGSMLLTDHCAHGFGPKYRELSSAPSLTPVSFVLLVLLQLAVHRFWH